MALWDGLDFNRIGSGGGAGNLLLGLGAGLLSGRNLREGIGQGFQNAQQMALLGNQQKRQASLDKLAADREARMAAWQDWLRQHQTERAAAEDAQRAASMGLQREQFDFTRTQADKPVAMDIPGPDNTVRKGFVRPTGEIVSTVGAPVSAGGVERDIAARRRAMETQGMDPTDPRNQQYLMSGKYPREDAQPLTSTDKKAIFTAEDENAVLANTLDSLNRAKALNDKTFTGVTAAARGWAGTAIPGADMLFDKGASEATREFGQLMSGEAMKQMSQTLKGATTDREMARFIEMLADPTTPPEIRGRTIDRMIKLTERQKAINDSRVNDLRGGSYFKPKDATAPAAEQPTKPKTMPSWRIIE